ncbi:MAG: hypothetical protein BWY62_01404 [Firmicutes bacterium ADurb.Bin356]|nr:MAG: hypothetical protein BWY62_01404 [Firmicutes bacterium ADurb.Bin356]
MPAALIITIPRLVFIWEMYSSIIERPAWSPKFVPSPIQIATGRLSSSALSKMNFMPSIILSLVKTAVVPLGTAEKFKLNLLAGFSFTAIISASGAAPI